MLSSSKKATQLLLDAARRYANSTRATLPSTSANNLSDASEDNGVRRSLGKENRPPVSQNTNNIPGLNMVSAKNNPMLNENAHSSNPRIAKRNQSTLAAAQQLRKYFHENASFQQVRNIENTLGLQERPYGHASSLDKLQDCIAESILQNPNPATMEDINKINQAIASLFENLSDEAIEAILKANVSEESMDMRHNEVATIRHFLQNPSEYDSKQALHISQNLWSALGKSMNNMNSKFDKLGDNEQARTLIATLKTNCNEVPYIRARINHGETTGGRVQELDTGEKTGEKHFDFSRLDSKLTKTNCAHNDNWNPEYSVSFKDDPTNFALISGLYSLGLGFGVSGTTPNILNFLNAIDTQFNLGLFDNIDDSNYLQANDLRDIIMTCVTPSFYKHSFHTPAETVAGLLCYLDTLYGNGQLALSDETFIDYMVSALEDVGQGEDYNTLLQSFKQCLEISKQANLETYGDSVIKQYESSEDTPFKLKLESTTAKFKQRLASMKEDQLAPEDPIQEASSRLQF